MGVAHAAGVCAAVYLLGRDGISLRDGVLIGCSAVYLLRYLLTAFFLLQRGVDWAEAAQVGPFLFALQAFFGFLGSRSSVPWHWVDCIAVSLYVVGSFLNTASELQRKRWKGVPDNKGHLYTGGLFSLSMHINYFGDALLFTGFALLTTSAWALFVPLVMTVLFLFLHIPTLDDYLAKRYPTEFEPWANRTKKFIPFVY
jgi:steroid 5-alpha reductase family enzyme